ncbi:MAG: c-type cytochrome [Chitinophagaceae bacterium]|nr:MAG: c-type cytochrome [Chitinophagaceae bacterium]
MKTTLVLTSLVLFVAACGSNGAHTNDPDIHADGRPKGEQLIAGSDCLSCHKDEEQLVGPAYKAVAERYAGKADAVQLLAGKIIKGGSGNWGQTPMTPHPGISQDDAEEMVRYILSKK